MRRFESWKSISDISLHLGRVNLQNVAILMINLLMQGIVFKARYERTTVRR